MTTSVLEAVQTLLKQISSEPHMLAFFSMCEGRNICAMERFDNNDSTVISLVNPDLLKLASKLTEAMHCYLEGTTSRSAMYSKINLLIKKGRMVFMETVDFDTFEKYRIFISINADGDTSPNNFITFDIA